MRLHFNRQNSDPFDFIIGTPQGSLVSPALSILYMSPLLHKMKTWSNASLGMYIDDGAIFACSKDWPTVEETLSNGYHTCITWLTNMGLNAEPDKTKLIYFRRHGEHTGHEPPPYIHLSLPSLNTYYRVSYSNTLRYLGFFFNHKLDWKQHVEVMCNQTHATLKALQILGNSICRLDHARWRLAYNAICLPALTYGCQMWFTSKQKTLVKKLQTVQNKAVRIILGTFHTMPQEPLHQLLTIFPMEVRLNMLLQNSALHLYKVPQESQLLRHLEGECTCQTPVTHHCPPQTTIMLHPHYANWPPVSKPMAHISTLPIHTSHCTRLEWPSKSNPKEQQVELPPDHRNPS